jgi:hypothetical protein
MKRFGPILCAVLCGATALAQRGSTPAVQLWSRFEVALTSTSMYENPPQDVVVEATFTGPSGNTHVVEAFWDGGSTWRVRFAPDEPGAWRYKTRASRPDTAGGKSPDPVADSGLGGQQGRFSVSRYIGVNALYRHGMLKVSDSRRYLVHADGTPFFWLGDTAWNGALLSESDGWSRYLADRARKRFTAIKFVTTQWRAATGDAGGRPAYTGRERIAIQHEFYRRMDERVDAINANGLVAAPVLLWANHRDDPGLTLSDEQAALLARYMVARYGAHHVIWILGGDSDYRGEKAERWRKIGRAVFPRGPRQPVTMHPQGRQWIANEFREESWFTFNCYQSGHGDNADTLRWLAEGPPATGWRDEPIRPHMNFEPNYEAHLSYHSRTPFDAQAVRRVAYWSLLVGPPAGVSYGAHGIWGWQMRAEEPLNHRGTGVAPAWPQAMLLPGSSDMRHLAELFATFDWWRLRPAPELLAEQPGTADPRRHIAIARTDDERVTVASVPMGDAVKLADGARGRARWFNPRAGLWTAAVSASGKHFAPPNDKDWVLVIRKR